MKKSILENYWVLGLMLIFVTIIIGGLVAIILMATGIESNFPSILSGLLAPVIVGYIYAGKLNKVISKKLRFRSTIIYLGFQLLVLIFCLLVDFKIEVLIITIIIIPFVSVIAALYNYWALGFYSDLYIKSSKQHKLNKAKK